MPNTVYIATSIDGYIARDDGTIDWLMDLPNPGNSDVRGELKTIIESLKEKGIFNLYIDGGKTIQSFLKEDLIDEMIITRIPVLPGSGIPLFDKNNLELVFEHVATEVHNKMLVRSQYLRKR